MIDVFTLSNTAIQVVNENISAIWRVSSGYTIAEDGTQVPAYTDSTVKVQAQALSGDALAATQGLNIQGVMRSVYMYGNVQGVVRSDERGGDLLIFAQTPNDAAQTWKIVTVVETWPTWAHVVACLQTDNSEETS